MKLNLTAKDLQPVGLLNGPKTYHLICYVPPINGHKPTTVFHKTAKEYDLHCDVCGKALVN